MTLARGSTAKLADDRVIEEPDLACGTRVGDYQVTGKIGQGGMGVVYAARHPDIGKEVAIKVVHGRLSNHPVVKSRVLQEARILTEISHPHVVDVYSFGRLPDGRSYLVMELVRGTSLAHRIDHDSLSLVEILTVLEQTAAALGACHEKGVVHRDLKPENILLRGRGPDINATLFDFGIAKAGGLHMQSGLTCEGTLVGTPEYMSPEQARAREVDARCDVYALGVVAYEMLTGRLPFRGATVVDTLSSILNDAPVPLGSLWDECPPGLEKLINDLLAKDADDRPSIEEVLVRLVSLRTELTPSIPKAAITVDIPTPAETARADTRLSLVISPAHKWLRRCAPVALVAFGLLLAWPAFQSGSRASAAESEPAAETDQRRPAAAVPATEPDREQHSEGARSVVPPPQKATRVATKAKNAAAQKRKRRGKNDKRRARRAIERERPASRSLSPDGLMPFPEDPR